jgi:hypothetical protein
VDVVGIGGGSLLVLMIETPHPFHTHTRSSLYIFNAIMHLQQWLVAIRMQLYLICALWNLRVDVVGIGGGSLLVLMIEPPQPFHTHTRSSLYIYNAI